MILENRVTITLEPHPMLPPQPEEDTGGCMMGGCIIGGCMIGGCIIGGAL